jgi:hypothetical protein
MLSGSACRQNCDLVGWLRHCCGKFASFLSSEEPGLQLIHVENALLIQTIYYYKKIFSGIIKDFVAWVTIRLFIIGAPFIVVELAIRPPTTGENAENPSVPIATVPTVSVRESMTCNS